MFWIVILVLLAIIFSFYFSWMGAIPFILILLVLLFSPMLVGVLICILTVFIILALLISTPLIPGCFLLLVIIILCGMFMTLF